jgi:chemotaxis family two-component system sensor kinase Cph1
VLGVAISAIVQVLHRTNAKLAAARAQLELANKQLSQRNEELQQFAYAVSHDLQTPLRNIGTMAGLLVRRNTDMDKDSKEYAHIIVSGVQRMKTIS